MKRKDIKKYILAIVDMVATLGIIVVMALALFSLAVMAGCSSSSKVTSSDIRQTHIENTRDSMSHTVRRDSVDITNTNTGSMVQNTTNRDRWRETNDSTIVTINPDGSKDTRTVRSVKSGETVHDTLWRDRWRDIVHTVYVSVRDSTREKLYEKRVDSLRNAITERKPSLRSRVFWSLCNSG